MSSYVTNLFSFSRNLPPPYDKLTSKKVSVASKYGDGKEATLSASVIKAVHAICGCKTQERLWQACTIKTRKR